MQTDFYILCTTAAFLGFFHTAIAPDHYLTFVAVGKANSWSIRKTLLVTFLCGLAHVTASILIGFIGLFIGLSINRLEYFDGLRGGLSSYLLIILGIVYALWGFKKLYTGKHHTHLEADKAGKLKGLASFWALFLIFAFGPCEVLIPLLLYPAAKLGLLPSLVIAGVFMAATIATMLVATAIAVKGLSFVDTSRFEKYGHVIAGSTIALSGILVKVLH